MLITWVIMTLNNSVEHAVFTKYPFIIYFISPSASPLLRPFSSIAYLPVLYPPLYQISLKFMYIYPPPLSRISQFSILASIRYLSSLCIYILPLFHVSPSCLSSPLSDISQVYVVCIHILHLYKVSPSSLSSPLSDISQVYVVCIHILHLYKVSPSSLSSPLSDISQVYIPSSSPSFTYLPVVYPPLYQISLKSM